MKFSTRKDTDRPAGTLFAAMTDFPRLERMLMRRGIEVRRVASGGEGAPAWRIGFDWRARRRDLTLSVAEVSAPDSLSLIGQSEDFELAVDLTVVALSRTRARLIVETVIQPRTMRARLMVQTARLGKARLDDRYDRRIREFLTEVTAV